MLTIRLQRIGKKNSPTYRFIISEKGRDTQGKSLEILGNYNPHDKENAIKVDAERVKYWLAAGAQTSNTVNNLLLKAGIVSGEKKRSVYISQTRAAKLAENKKAAAPKEAPVAAPAPVVETAPVATPAPVVEPAPAPEPAPVVESTAPAEKPAEQPAPAGEPVPPAEQPAA
jgi:small subunit ribosomal protein S16